MVDLLIPMISKTNFCYSVSTHLRVWCHAELHISAIKDHKLSVEEGVSENLDPVIIIGLDGTKATCPAKYVSVILSTACTLRGYGGNALRECMSRKR